MNMGVSQLPYMYVTSLIIMTFNIIIIKHQNMLKSTICKHVNKMGVRDSYQNQEVSSLYLKQWWSSHQTPLESDASKIVTV